MLCDERWDQDSADETSSFLEGVDQTIGFWLVVEPTHLKKYARQIGFIFPK